MKIGHIYILVNASMPNLLKIGMTTRNPKSRAAELSSTTSVPSPFYVAYSAKVSNCKDAEKEIHTELKRFRASSQREFFNIELDKAVQIILEIAGKYRITENQQDQPKKTNKKPLTLRKQELAYYRSHVYDARLLAFFLDAKIATRKSNIELSNKFSAILDYPNLDEAFEQCHEIDNFSMRFFKTKRNLYSIGVSIVDEGLTFKNSRSCSFKIKFAYDSIDELQYNEGISTFSDFMPGARARK